MPLTEQRYSDTAGTVASEKAAGAPVEFGKSGEVTERPTSALGSYQDILDFAERSVEEANRRLAAANELSCVESYNKGRACIVIARLASFAAHEFDLVFCAIPKRSESVEIIEALKAKVFDGDVCAESYRNQGCMSGITHLVKGPDGVIPSLVWLEPAKERFNLFRNIAAPSLQSVLEPVFVVADRESGPLGPSGSRTGSRSVGGLVENSPHVEKSVKNQILPNVRDFLSELEFVNLVNSIRLQLDHERVWLFAKESLDPLVKIDKVMLCAK
jgi:hypothetical protein